MSPGRHPNRQKNRRREQAPSNRGGRNKPPDPTWPHKITSPYNFVPLHEEVWFPDKDREVHQGMQDIPFSDGLSGEIDCTFEAKTPIFIRHGDKDDPSFYKLPGSNHYALPSTSVKGMIRNVFEIVTFSRLSGMDQKRRYSVRDLSNPDPKLYGEWMTKQDQPHESKPMAGWLRRTQGGWEISPCDYVRVDTFDLEELLPNKQKNWIHQKNALQNRYRNWMNHVKTRQISFEIEEPPTEGFFSRSCKKKLLYRRTHSVSLEKGWSKVKKNGWLVFAGQPMNYRPGAKHREFIFMDGGGEWFPVDSEIFDDFELNHPRPEGKNGDREWNWGFWKKQASKDWEENRNGPGIPVFYLAYKDQSPEPSSSPVALDQGGTLRSFGLSLMYRLAYRLRLGQALPEDHRVPVEDSKEPWVPDAAETVFGYARGQVASRGRVWFTPCPVEGKHEVLQIQSEVLSSPRPTYYPNYIQQPSQLKEGHLLGIFKTLMDEDARLKGWKRYPVRKDGNTPGSNPAPNENAGMETRFQPLKAGVRFRGKVLFHNLRPWELGALLWSMSFGEPDNSNLRHSLGLAKPLGYGSVQLQADLRLENAAPLSDGKHWNVQNLISKFEETIKHEFLNKELRSTSQVTELKAMANQESQPVEEDDLLYPTAFYNQLVPNQDTKKAVQSFAKMIHKKLGLRKFSDMAQAKAPPSAQENDSRGKQAFYPNQQKNTGLKGSTGTYVYLGKFKKGKPADDGNPKFQLKGGKSTDVGFLKDASDKEKIPADAEPGKWQVKFTVVSGMPGNYQLKFSGGSN